VDENEKERMLYFLVRQTNKFGVGFEFSGASKPTKTR
jgi:hypothetical protein